MVLSVLLWVEGSMGDVMKQTVVAKFPGVRSVSQVKQRLTDVGVPLYDISILQKHMSEGESLLEESLVSRTLNGMVSGIIAGAGIGAIMGLFIGVGLINFTGVNWFLLAVPLVHLLGFSGVFATAGSGFILGGIVGAGIGIIMGLSIPDRDVFTYEEQLQPGEHMLAVNVTDSEAPFIRQLLRKFGGYNLQVRNSGSSHERVGYASPFSVMGLKGGKSEKK